MTRHFWWLAACAGAWRTCSAVVKNASTDATSAAVSPAAQAACADAHEQHRNVHVRQPLKPCGATAVCCTKQRTEVSAHADMDSALRRRRTGLGTRESEGESRGSSRARGVRQPHRKRPFHEQSALLPQSSSVHSAALVATVEVVRAPARHGLRLARCAAPKRDRITADDPARRRGAALPQAGSAAPAAASAQRGEGRACPPQLGASAPPHSACVMAAVPTGPTGCVATHCAAAPR